ncbi:MAG: NADPH-dependent 2,4-dienoyl-CoA reductase/sulfur reductase-like enzyme [Planctomycetota bacterium]|jgi:NADPH-dependent 2,4-dienoyl-CoA reductase/sulfur reductase-like enzyme
MKSSQCRVAVIGAGPGGLSIATELKNQGVDHVTLLERENSAGGIPRHCGHSPFGMREFHRILDGAEYTRRLTRQAEEAGVEIRLGTTVTELGQSGELSLSTREGLQRLEANRVVICTGAREKPRSARLVSGTRPQGVTTTGALQSMIYLKQQKPFKQPVIIGSEMVAFSALLSCRHAGIKPVAMIEAEPAISWWQIAGLFPRLLGTSVLTNTSLESIQGDNKVESVTIKHSSGEIMTIECDGVIFTGKFIGESSLAKMAGFVIDGDSNSPLLDAYGRCSNINYFASGNLCYPLKTAGQCWREGREIARLVKASLDGQLPHQWAPSNP